MGLIHPHHLALLITAAAPADVLARPAAEYTLNTLVIQKRTDRNVSNKQDELSNFS